MRSENDILAYKNSGEDNDDEGCELLATFGMLRSDLVEILAMIRVSVHGLESIIATNKGISQKESDLIISAIENYENLYDLFTLGNEIPKKEVSRLVRSIHAKTNLMDKIEALKTNLSDAVGDTPATTYEEEPDSMVKRLFGNEHT